MQRKEGQQRNDRVIDCCKPILRLRLAEKVETDDHIFCFQHKSAVYISKIKVSFTLIDLLWITKLIEPYCLRF